MNIPVFTKRTALIVLLILGLIFTFFSKGWLFWWGGFIIGVIVKLTIDEGSKLIDQWSKDVEDAENLR